MTHTHTYTRTHTPKHKLATVRDDKAVEVPRVAENVCEQFPVGTGGHTVDGVVATHVGHDPSICTRSKGRLEGLQPITVVYHSIKVKATRGNVLWSRVDIKMFASGLGGGGGREETDPLAQCYLTGPSTVRAMVGLLQYVSLHSAEHFLCPPPPPPPPLIF